MEGVQDTTGSPHQHAEGACVFLRRKEDISCLGNAAAMFLASFRVVKSQIHWRMSTVDVAIGADRISGGQKLGKRKVYSPPTYHQASIFFYYQQRQPSAPNTTLVSILPIPSTLTHQVPPPSLLLYQRPCRSPQRPLPHP